MEFVFAIPTPPAAFIFSIPAAPVAFTFSIPNTLIMLAGIVELELISGDIDGVNDTFIFDGPPFFVYNSGLLKKEGVAYTRTGNQIVFNPGHIPYTDDVVWAYKQLES